MILIEKDKALEHISYDEEWTEECINALPTIEIVRCRECRHAFINEYHEDKPLICGLTKMCGTTDPDWFCADGERRTDE